MASREINEHCFTITEPITVGIFDPVQRHWLTASCDPEVTTTSLGNQHSTLSRDMSVAGTEFEVEVHSSTCRRISAKCQAGRQSTGGSHYHTTQDMHSRKRFYGSRKQVIMISDFIIEAAAVNKTWDALMPTLASLLVSTEVVVRTNYVEAMTTQLTSRQLPISRFGEIRDSLRTLWYSALSRVSPRGKFSANDSNFCKRNISHWLRIVQIYPELMACMHFSKSTLCIFACQNSHLSTHNSEIFDKW